jgi:hypothetical protein
MVSTQSFQKQRGLIHLFLFNSSCYLISIDISVILEPELKGHLFQASHFIDKETGAGRS